MIPGFHWSQCLASDWSRLIMWPEYWALIGCCKWQHGHCVPHHPRVRSEENVDAINQKNLSPNGSIKTPLYRLIELRLTFGYSNPGPNLRFLRSDPIWSTFIFSEFVRAIHNQQARLIIFITSIYKHEKKLEIHFSNIKHLDCLNIETFCVSIRGQLKEMCSKKSTHNELILNRYHFTNNIYRMWPGYSWCNAFLLRVEIEKWVDT